MRRLRSLARGSDDAKFSVDPSTLSRGPFTSEQLSGVRVDPVLWPHICDEALSHLDYVSLDGSGDSVGHFHRQKINPTFVEILPRPSLVSVSSLCRREIRTELGIGHSCVRPLLLIGENRAPHLLPMPDRQNKRKTEGRGASETSKREKTTTTDGACLTLSQEMWYQLSLTLRQTRRSRSSEPDRDPPSFGKPSVGSWNRSPFPTLRRLSTSSPASTTSSSFSPFVDVSFVWYLPPVHMHGLTHRMYHSCSFVCGFLLEVGFHPLGDCLCNYISPGFSLTPHVIWR